MHHPVDLADRSQALSLPPLPVQLTSFVGRARELADVRQLLTSSRLVTLTGAGGCGKTRLALRVASDLWGPYAGCVGWVQLAPLADPSLVPQAVAKALNAFVPPGFSVLDAVLSLLHDRRLLLVLDNCEHLAAACAEFAQAVLGDAPGVTILATSREPLGLSGELLYPVTPLSLPPPSVGTDLLRFDAIRLFVERARGVRPDFTLTSANGKTIAEICRRLDGLPLAIELASARINALTLDQVVARLDDRFALLSSTAHGIPSHHRTLGAAVDWSYDSLSTQEQTLLRRLSVFAGGCTLAAVERVCADEDLPSERVVDVLSSLISKSLVAAQTLKPGEARYHMLETIRQYAGHKSNASGETERLRDRHLEHYLELAEKAQPKLNSAEQLPWFEQVESEIDNIRLALEWSATQSRFEEGLRIIDALNFFWYTRGYWRETYARLVELLKSASARPPSLTQGNALSTAGQLAVQLGHFEDSFAYYQESIKILREVGEKGKTLLESALSSYALGVVFYDPVAGRRYAEEAAQLCRTSGNRYCLGIALTVLAMAAEYSGDFDFARRCYEQAAREKLEIGDRSSYARVLSVYGRACAYHGDVEKAAALLDEAMAISVELGDRWNQSVARMGLGIVARVRNQFDQAESLLAQTLLEFHDLGEVRIAVPTFVQLALVKLAQGNHAGAAQHLRDSLSAAGEAHTRIFVPWALEASAFLLVSPRKPGIAARLLSSAQALRAELGMPNWPVNRDEYQSHLATVHAQLDAASFHTAWEEGRAMTIDQAMAEAEQELSLHAAAPPPVEPRDPNALTPREVEVLRLVAAGLSNEEVAAKLVISRRTVSTHLSAIYGKLGVTSRTAAARAALDRNLI